ncbi:hypothetical protein COCON_G00073070 [Conger conger]|uniref:NEDD4-binding protein 2-like 1 n=1 Tax=Conger conger TaxID=82655 RepID=A0A9Q1I1Y1_CONCO|nr:hypothetical protein COCON_G00073070 [Conger conger]
MNRRQKKRKIYLGFGDWPDLFILRGLPGSKKSQLARKIQARYGHTGLILSTDDYFKDKNGNFNFDYSQLGPAHAWNRDRAEEAMRNRVHPIIIDNCNIRRRHMKPYVQMGLEYVYYIRFMETPNYSVDELHERYPEIDKQDLHRKKRNYEPAKTVYDVLYDIYPARRRVINGHWRRRRARRCFTK